MKKTITVFVVMGRGKMTYNGTNESAIDILKLVGPERIKSFSKLDDGALLIWYWFPDKKDAARYHISPGDRVFTSVSGMLRIISDE